ncbi:MAG: Na+/H+ antiporter NhaC family protein [Gammaproteobacteria bacterium]|nr:Na+/H+ antiporter NhaC family protein [Gammaproteobacteria bacterium]MDG2339107.1 Na+/H+ antiporter NhaC family protein [Gammaproteobacteria bacterium]
MNKLAIAFSPAFWAFSISVFASLYVHFFVSPTWVEQRTTIQVFVDDQGQHFYLQEGQTLLIDEIVPYAESPLRQDALDETRKSPPLESQWVVEVNDITGEQRFSILQASPHFRGWSLLPSLIAICLCLLTREPLTSLFAGMVVGAFMLGNFNLLDEVLIPVFASTNSAGILLLYLWLLGGLLGVWTRTGAAQQFADHMAQKFVHGPRSAKFIAWLLGLVFFQGGSVSTVLAGVAIKPLADKRRVSHEETSYIVDATGAPVASLLAFNAWPLFVQSLIFVPGVAFLSSESSRISFYFSSLGFSFYSIIMILGALMLSLNIKGFPGRGLLQARKRTSETGELDGPSAVPISAPELHDKHVPLGYSPSVVEFIAPLLLLISIAIGSFILLGSPQVNWAFGAALLLAIVIALLKGMSLRHVIDGIGNGLKGVIMAVTIMMLAIILGGISAETGGGLYLIDLLGDRIPYYSLPAVLLILTIVTSVSTGSSWGTYAIAFPLAMPLAWAITEGQCIANPELYMSICFACVLNGGVFGDQCSPISDTTILSATTTGCDLMDHVKTQFEPAAYTAGVSAILWTISAIVIA